MKRMIFSGFIAVVFGFVAVASFIAFCAEYEPLMAVATVLCSFMSIIGLGSLFDGTHISKRMTEGLFGKEDEL